MGCIISSHGRDDQAELESITEFRVISFKISHPTARWMLFCLGLFVFVTSTALCQNSVIQTRPMSLEIMPIAYFKPKMHTGLGWWPTRLADLDHDGYDDFAIASSTDSTFIFYGGDTINIEPRYKIPGGSGGVVAGDFNGDGYVDIANTITEEFDTSKHGCVRIYLNTKGIPPFHDQPDQIIKGSYEWALYGRMSDSRFRGIIVGDVNGDGYSDLIMSSNQYDSSHVPEWYVCNIIFFGGHRFSEKPDVIISPTMFGNHISHKYRFGYSRIGDVNGDDYSDLLFAAEFKDSLLVMHRQWELFLGYSGARYSTPDYVIPSATGDLDPFFTNCAIADLNQDGYDEIISGDAPYYGNIKYLRGAPFYNLPIEMNDSLYNPDPTMYKWGGVPKKVGDMNGDGTNDVMVQWITDMIPDGRVYHLYPDCLGNEGKYSHGSYGSVLNLIDLEEGVDDVGDVNGDGYDDVAMVGRPRRNDPLSRFLTVQILGGNAKLVSLDVVPANPHTIRLEVYPNPVSSDARLFRVRCPHCSGYAGTIRVFDALGRVITSKSIQNGETSSVTTFDVSGFAKGCYYIQYSSLKDYAGTRIIVY
jgi:hypothetical protein